MDSVFPFDPGTPDGREKLLLEEIPIVISHRMSHQPQPAPNVLQNAAPRGREKIGVKNIAYPVTDPSETERSRHIADSVFTSPGLIITEDLANGCKHVRSVSLVDRQRLVVTKL